MKRLHVHVTVENLEESVKFYSTMFGVEPVKLKTDYAKWLVEDPRVNFAISARGRKPGFDHLGIQVEKDSELAEVRGRLKKADMQTFGEGQSTCCYSKADKTWVKDPSGLAWETYKNMEDAEIFGKNQDVRTEDVEKACCAPSPSQSDTPETQATPAKKTSCC
jgi:catechol-2,3-dioxygenase